MKKEEKLIIVILLAPIIILIGIGIYLFNFTDIFVQFFSLRNKLYLTKNDVPTLKDTLYYLMSGYTMIITGIFSYYIYKSGEKSNELSELIINREYQENIQKKEEVAFSIYYNVLFILKELLNEFRDHCHNKAIKSTFKLKKESMNDLSFLVNYLNRNQLLNLYSFYEEVYILSSISENEIRKNKIEKLFDKIFKKDLKFWVLQNIIEVECLLENDFFNLLSKIRNLNHSDENVDITVDNKYYNGLKRLEFIDGGNTKIEYGYYKNNNQFYELHYKDNKTIKIKIFDEKMEVLSDVSYLSGEDGYTTLFHNYGVKLYEGWIKNSKYHGKGIQYFSNGNKKFEGEFNEGIITEGKEFLSSKETLIFEGEFKDGKKWSGTGYILIEDSTGFDYFKEYEENPLHSDEGYIEHQYQLQLELENDPNYIEYMEDCYKNSFDYPYEFEKNSVLLQYDKWEEYLGCKYENGGINLFENRSINKKCIGIK